MITKSKLLNELNNTIAHYYAEANHYDNFGDMIWRDYMLAMATQGERFFLELTLADKATVEFLNEIAAFTNYSRDTEKNTVIQKPILIVYCPDDLL
jgi:hypothetical protein